MSELENIVHHIVQHEEEQQAEKIKLESEIKTLEEVLEHGISTEFVEDEVIYIYSPKTAHDMREKLYENYNRLHAQLTIPKSIAERLDKEGSYDSAFVYPRTWELEVQGTLESCRRINVQKIYLISKALGVDLVKVVEG